MTVAVSPSTGGAPGTDPPADPLAPVRDALLDHARRDAAAELAEAQQQAAAALAEAEAAADARRTKAREEGEQDAQAVRLQQQARARRSGRGIVLAAQSESLALLRAQVRAAVRAWWDDPGTRPLVRARLAEKAVADLGPQAELRDHPDGGLVATAAGRRATYLLGDLADAALDAMGADLARAWQP